MTLNGVTALILLYFNEFVVIHCYLPTFPNLVSMCNVFDAGCCKTAAVPAHVDTDPPIGQAAEMDIVAELTRANTIVDGLRQTSPNVIRLLSRLSENPSPRERTMIEDQLVNEIEAALYQGGVPPGMVPGLARLLATGIRMACAGRGGSVIVYFMCKTVQTLYALGQMIVSGFMHAVFAVVVESLARTTVDVYVKADEFNLRLLCVTCPQDRGLSID